MIHADNIVWFHDHAEDDECNDNCFEQVNTAPIPIMHTLYFLRIDGELRQVLPLTHGHKHNRWMVKVEVMGTGQIVSVHDDDLIRHYIHST